MSRLLLIISIFSFIGCSNKLSKKEFEKAKAIFNSNCASCHGEKGYGDGQAASSFNPPPRNFHLPTEKWVNGKTIQGVTKTLTYGIEPNMWKYGGSPEDIAILAKYVIHLGNTD